MSTFPFKSEAVMHESSPSPNQESSIERLGSEEGGARRAARVALVALGKAAVPTRIRALQESANAHARWGAVKALREIGDARAIPSLVTALDDDNPDVAWLAAEALHDFARAAWTPLLRRLIRDGPHSVLLRQRAHCVFRDQSAEGFDDLLAALLQALDSITLPETTAVAAFEVLHRMRSTA
jgi:HEAT repeat protein